MNYHLSKIFSSLILILWAIVAVVYLQSKDSLDNSTLLKSKSELAARLLLTDLCLTTESRHTRHISQSDWVAPFQDLPGFYDHFPSSAFFPAPDSSRWINRSPRRKDSHQ